VRYHGSARGSVQIDLSTGESAAIKPPFAIYQWHLVHGILMTLSLGLMLPIGVLIARFAKPHVDQGASKAWLHAHLTLQLLGLGLAIAGVAIALARDEFGTLDTAHGTLGLVVISIAICQPINAVLRPHKSNPPTNGRRVWEYLHRGSGYSVLALATVNIFLGLERYTHVAALVDTEVTLAYSLYIIILASLLVAMALLTRSKANARRLQQQMVSEMMTRKNVDVSSTIGS